jgi:hypothetical protein
VLESTTIEAMTDQPHEAPPASRPAKRHESHPLLGGFPLTVMTLTAFLAVFVLMMARLTAGADPALHAIATAALVERGPAARLVTTRTSGGSSAAGIAPVAGATPALPKAPTIVTRTSGSTGFAQVGDD